MSYNFIYYVLILLGFFNGIIISLFIALIARSNTFLKLAALAVFLFSLTILREFIYMFGSELNMNFFFEKFLFFKLLSVGVLIFAYNKEYSPESKINIYLIVPGLLEFFLLSSITLGLIRLSNVFSDAMFISVDIISFFWIGYEYLKKRRQDSKKIENLRFLLLFVIGFMMILLTRLIQFLALLIESSFLYELHFVMRVSSIGVLIYMLSFYLIFLFAKHQRKKALKNKSIKPRGKEFLERIKRDRNYLSKNITLEKLASSYSVDSKILSSTIREHEKSTFNDYINSLRIEYFVELIKNAEHKKFTIMALAEKSGFNSKATFNRAFKKIHGVSPTNYIQDLK